MQTDLFNALVGQKPGGTRFILVRHGETDWNKEKRFQGHTNIPLNANGLAQAQFIQRYFKHLSARGLSVYEHCISSDLDRAHTTARTIHGHKLPALVLNQHLRERSYGHLSGLTGDEMHAQSPLEFAKLQSREPDALIQGGESLRQFYERVIGAFQQIALEQQGSTILLVAHGGVLDCIYRHCTNKPLEQQRDWQLPNCALNVVEIDSQGNASIGLWAWKEHLDHDSAGQNIDEVDGRIA